MVSIVILAFAYIHTLSSIQYKGKLGNRKVILVITIAGVILAVLFAIYNASKFIIVQRFMGKYVVGDAVRKELRAVAWEVFVSNPIWGRGLGSVSTYYGTYSHSLYFEILASMGIVGLLVLIIPLLKYMITFYKDSKRIFKHSYNAMVARMMGWSIFMVVLTGYSQIYVYYFFFYVYIAIWISSKRVLMNDEILIT